MPPLFMPPLFGSSRNLPPPTPAGTIQAIKNNNFGQGTQDWVNQHATTPGQQLTAHVTTTCV
eukprot:2421305-Heterocapsa_arctica.AAC.1